jgi:hypothetical protein
MLVGPFDTLAQRITEEFREAIKHEIRRYKWIEKERGRDLSWDEAWNEWTLAHRENLGQFLSAGRYREKRSPRRSVRYKVGDDLVMEAGSEVAEPHGK